MQVIPALSSVQYVPHIIETPDDIIINSQIYDKDTMQPKPFHFYNFANVSSCFNELEQTVSRIGNKYAMPCKDDNAKNIIQDFENPDIFYMLWYSSTNANVMYMSKIKKIDKSYSMLSNILLRSSGKNNTGDNGNVEINQGKFLCQTKDYIIVSDGHVTRYNNSSYTSNYDLRNLTIRRVSKKDLSYVMTMHYYSELWPENGSSNKTKVFGFSHYLIKYNESYVYFYAYYGCEMSIFKYNISNNTCEKLYTFASNYLLRNSIGPSNIVFFNNNYYTLTGNITDLCYSLQEINISKDDIVTVKEYKISNHNNFPYVKSGYRPNDGANGKIPGFLIYTLKVIDNKRLSLVIHNNENRDIMLENNKLGIIEYDKTNKTFIFSQILDIDKCYGALYPSNSTCVLLLQKGYEVYKLNVNKWEKVFEEAGTFYCIGLDSYKRLYVINNSNIIKIHSNIVSSRVELSFDIEDYTYTGVPISATCKFGVLNYLNNYIDAKVRIVLSGPIIFNDGAKMITTRTDGILKELGVQIIGSGKISASIIEMEG